MEKYLVIGSIIVLSLTVIQYSYAQNPNPHCNPGVTFNAQLCYQTTTDNQNALGAQGIFAILQNIGGFLMAAAGVIAGIVIIVAGLVWVSAGSNQTRVTSAKTIFKNGVLGSLIIFAAGLIINTIVLLATQWQSFFNS